MATGDSRGLLSRSAIRLSRFHGITAQQTLSPWARSTRFAACWASSAGPTIRDIAVKVPLGKFVDDEAGRKRFSREAETWSGLIHPHIVRAFDVRDDQTTDCRPAVFMDYCQGGSLADRLRGSLPLPMADYRFRCSRRPMSATTAASSGNLPVCSLEKTNWPSADSSKQPPDAGSSSRLDSFCLYSDNSLAARLTALGS
jgi:hypothetical protein